MQFLHLNPKFQASSHLLWLYRPVCVGPGRKPRRPVFSKRGSYEETAGLDSGGSTKQNRQLVYLMIIDSNFIISTRYFYCLQTQIRITLWQFYLICTNNMVYRRNIENHLCIFWSIVSYYTLAQRLYNLFHAQLYWSWNMEDYTINISVRKKIKYLQRESRNCQLPLFPFPIISIGTIGCHSNQSSYPTRIKNNLYRG